MDTPDSCRRNVNCCEAQQCWIADRSFRHMGVERVHGVGCGSKRRFVVLRFRSEGGHGSTTPCAKSAENSPEQAQQYLAIRSPHQPAQATWAAERRRIPPALLRRRV